jgi:hypothetical protein
MRKIRRMNAEPPTMIPISAVLLIFELLPLLAAFGDPDCSTNDEETLDWTEPASFVMLRAERLNLNEHAIKGRNKTEMRLTGYH